MSNQVVLPGLGTVVAGRRTGYVQMALATIGLVLTGAFAIVFFRRLLQMGHLPQDPEELFGFLQQNLGWFKVGGLGFGSFGLAWCWALVSSLDLLRQAGGPPDA